MRRAAVTASLLALTLAAAPSFGAVEVVSWNLHGVHFQGGGERIPRAAETILAMRPDFVLLQEVWVHSHGRWLIERFRQAGYEEAEYESISPLRTGGLLVFVDGRRGWRVVSRRFVEYQAMSLRFWEGDPVSGKGMLIVEVEDPRRRRFTLIDTHLQAQYGERRKYTSVRRSQLRQLAREAAAANAWLVAGDLNTTPDDPLYAEFVRAGWHDLTRPYREACKCGTHFHKGKVTDWIDYVFLREPLPATTSLIENTKTDDPWSDHQGVRVLIEMPRR